MSELERRRELEARAAAAIAFLRLVLEARRQGRLGELVLVLGAASRRALEGARGDRHPT